MRYSVTLCYNGSGFCGWQSQPDAATVQDTLEDALSKLLRSDISVVGAGRTDSGVNAIGYVAHFDAPAEVDTEALGYKLNAILPPSIVVFNVQKTADDFHARFDASSREYTYFLHRRKDPFCDRFSYQCMYKLDIDAMNDAAALLVGTHDFRCFQKTGGDNKTSICTVKEAVWVPYTPSHCSVLHFPAGEDDYLYFRITADRFLRNMVRAVVGSLLDVGRGKKSIAAFAELILPETAEPGTGSLLSRSDAGESVPGHALFLSKVEY